MGIIIDMIEKFTILNLLAVSALAQIVTPGDKCCTLYSAASYGGTSLDLCYTGTTED